MGNQNALDLVIYVTLLNANNTFKKYNIYFNNLNLLNYEFLIYEFLGEEESEDFNGIQTGSQVVSTTQEYDGGEKIDCQVSDWSDWSYCKNCQGYTTKIRSILVINYSFTSQTNIN